MIYLIFLFVFLPLFVHMSYVYTMGVKKARGEGNLSKPVLFFIVPTLAVMLPFYVLLNIVVGSIIFLELPRTYQFTARCQRHMHDDTWRGAQARWWCKHFLDPYDPAGKHC